MPISDEEFEADDKFRNKPTLEKIQGILKQVEIGKHQLQIQSIWK